MNWLDYVLMGLGVMVAVAFGLWLVLLFVHLIMVKWGQASFTAATLAEAMGRARYYRWRCERMENVGPLLDRVEGVVFGDLPDEEKIEVLEMLLSDGEPEVFSADVKVAP